MFKSSIVLAGVFLGMTAVAAMADRERPDPQTDTSVDIGVNGEGGEGGAGGQGGQGGYGGGAAAESTADATGGFSSSGVRITNEAAANSAIAPDITGGNCSFNLGLAGTTLGQSASGGISFPVRCDANENTRAGIIAKLGGDSLALTYLAQVDPQVRAALRAQANVAGATDVATGEVMVSYAKCEMNGNTIVVRPIIGADAAVAKAECLNALGY